MRTVLAVAALMLFCLAPLSSVGGPPAPKSDFKPVDIGDSSNEIVQLAKHEVVGQAAPPADLKGRPAKGSGILSYFQAHVRGSSVILAVDYTAGASKLYVDLDGSGDLSHFRPLVSSQTSTKTHTFQPFQVKIGEDKVALKVEVIGLNRLMIYPATMLSGNVKFGDKSYHVLLVDADLDGTYNHYYTGKSPAASHPVRTTSGKVVNMDSSAGQSYDVFAIDLKGTGKIEPEVGGVMEAMPLPKMLRVNGAYYKITVSADGQSIDTSPVENPKTGTISVACDCVDLALCSEDGGYRLCGGKTKLELPAGDFSVTSYRLAKKDNRGDLWTLNGTLASGSQLSIKTGETDTLKLGTPITVKANVSTVKGGEVSIGFSMADANGDPLDLVAQKNGIRQNPPSVKILSADTGKVLSQGTLGYG